MAAEIGHLSITQIQKLSQSQHHQNQVPQPNPNSITTTTTSISSTWMWNPKEQEEAEEDDSWEVRAFAEDTRNIMNTTWPPRSYTCTFCRREFRSAQALGGHMNVHRRDRARLHQAHHPPGPSSRPFINIPPHQELVANAGLCFLYHLPSPNNTSSTTLLNGDQSPSTLLSISSSSYPPNNLMMQTFSPSFNFPGAHEAAPLGNGMNSTFSSYCSTNNSSKVEQQPTTSTSIDNGHHEELDLELRLGHKPPSA